MIKIENLNHQIAGNTILEDISLELPKGGITALIGPNGAGKSTLLNLVARQIPLQSGRIELDGEELSRISQSELAKRLALVAQQVGVASRLRVEDLVRFGRWPHAQGRLREEDHSVVERAIEAFDLVDLRRRFLDQLSGGQRQRAFIAMALAQDTDWLLLDEPLNNLDMFHARELMSVLSRLANEAHKSILLVIHEVNYAAAWADHVIGLKQGRLILEGPPAEALSREHIRNLFGVDASVMAQEKTSFINHYAPV